MDSITSSIKVYTTKETTHPTDRYVSTIGRVVGG